MSITINVKGRVGRGGGVEQLFPGSLWTRPRLVLVVRLYTAKGEERRSEMLIDSDRLIGCIAFEKRGVVGTRKASPIGRCRKSYLKYIHKTPASKSDGEL